MEQENMGVDVDPEMEALAKVYSALRSLDAPAQHRVLDYVITRLGLRRDVFGTPTSPPPPREDEGGASGEESPEDAVASTEHDVPQDAGTEDSSDAGLDEGISPVAKKWMRRNQLSASDLAPVFSLGADEIDLVVRSVPGPSVKQRMRRVVLLQGIAAYLGSGVAKFEHRKLKEALSHYKADPERNFTTYIKEMKAEVSGNAASGYTLTNRGLTAGTELVREMTSTSRPAVAK